MKTSIWFKKTDILNYCEDFYIDYVNDFLTVERFAEYYEMDIGVAKAVLDIGRAVNEKRPSKYPTMYQTQQAEKEEIPF